MRLGFVLVLGILLACNNDKKGSEAKNDDKSFSYENFSNKFKTSSVPYSISDTGLLKNTDTTTLRSFATEHIIPDSILNKAFSKGAKIRFTPLVKIEVPKKETYFIVKATGGDGNAAFMVVFNEQKQYSASFPFLVVDSDNNTSQLSSIDRSYTISRATTKKAKDGTNKEGRDVYAYNSAANTFTLIMTDLLEDNNVLINPIDTLKRTQKWTGDYGREKNNLISIRDGRTPNERMVFIHFEKEEGTCTGELKGYVLMTSSNEAVYRGGSDPCVLTLRFQGSSVSLHEENCGNHRDVRCMFEGSYQRKAEPKTKSKSNDKKSSAKKAATP
jgi:hypothetical protein